MCISSQSTITCVSSASPTRITVRSATQNRPFIVRLVVCAAALYNIDKRLWRDSKRIHFSQNARAQRSFFAHIFFVLPCVYCVDTLRTVGKLSVCPLLSAYNAKNIFLLSRRNFQKKICLCSRVFQLKKETRAFFVYIRHLYSISSLFCYLFIKYNCWCF